MKKDDEVIRFAGDVSIDKIEVISANGLGQEITNQVVNLEIYEDIFSPFITGVIVLKESIDYLNLFPMIGEEYVNIKIHTPSFTKKDMIIDDQFVIYKVSDRIQANDRNQMYALHFISREALVDMNKNVSRSYQGKISDIVEDIITDKFSGLESTKKTNIEETPNSTKYVSNYWSPIKNINYLADRAKNIDGSANFVFFENRLGLNFGSLATLYSQPAPRQEFVYDAYFRDFTASGAKRDVNKEYQRIIEIEIPVVFDYMDRVNSGMYASKKIGYDLVTKKYKVKTYDMLDDFDEHKHLNKHPANSNRIVKYPNQKIMHSQLHYANFNNYTDVTNSSSVQQRLSLMKQAESTKIQITVPGRTDYTVGDKVKLTLNKFNPIKTSDTDDDIIDNLFSGNYIISTINHMIDREKHECYMELIKDSYIVNFNNGGVR